MKYIRWTPEVGDPTFLGWFIFFAYFVCAWFCFQALKAEHAGPRRSLWNLVWMPLLELKRHWPHPPLPTKRSLLWLGISILLGALGINKQLDLQALLGEIAFLASYDQGWHDHWDDAQRLFAIALLIAGSASLVLLWYTTRDILKEFRLTLTGLSVLACFLFLRAASFNGLDIFMREGLFRARLNGLFELTGIFLTGLGASHRVKALRRK